MRWLVVLVALVLAACSSDPPAPVGVNDVRKACEIRTTWSRASTASCRDCKAISSTPPCDCPLLQRDYAGRCNPHREAKAAESTCFGVDQCVFDCPDNDCNCVDRCYANKEVCRERSAALDGCVAETCDPECR